MNPRWVAYAAAHDRTPEDQLAHDRERWPGGVMAGFTCWIQAQWQAWRQMHGRRAHCHLTPEDHASFDAFIGASCS